MATKRIDGLDLPNKVIQTDVNGNLYSGDLIIPTGTFTPTIAVIGTPTGFTYTSSGSNVTVNYSGKVVTVNYVINGTTTVSSSPIGFELELTNANAVAPNISITRQVALMSLNGVLSSNSVLCSLYWVAGKLRLSFASANFTASSATTALNGQITYISQ